MTNSSFAACCNVVEDIAPLLSQGRNGRQHPLDKVTACTTLGTKAPFAPEHDGTEGPLCRVIRKLHALSVDKGPQGRLVLQQRAAQSGTLGVFTRRPLAQKGANLHPELCAT